MGATRVVAPTARLDLRRVEDLEVAYRAHAGELERFATRQLRDHSAAAEVVQEVFVRAWRHAASYDPSRASLRVWLYSIARNVVIDRARHREKRPGAPTAPEVLSEIGDHAAGAHGSDGLGDRLDDGFSDDMITTWFVQEALERLPDEQRRAIVETYVRGRSYAEVAAEQTVPVGTLRSRVFYGLRALRAITNDMGTPL